MTESLSFNAPTTRDWTVGVQKRRNDEELIGSVSKRVSQLLGRLEFGAPLNVLSLTADLALWEQSFAQSMGLDTRIKVTAIERDPEVLQRLQDNAAEIMRNQRNLELVVPSRACGVTQTLEAADVVIPYDLVYLDYMGTWAADKKEDLRLLFTRGYLKAGSVLALTFSLKRGDSPELQELKKLAPNNPVRHVSIQGPSYNTLAGYRGVEKPRLKDGSRPASPVTKLMRVHGIPVAIHRLAESCGVKISQHWDVDALEYSNDAAEKEGPMCVFVFTVLEAPQPTTETRTPSGFEL
jgi:hypothetical protein